VRLFGVIHFISILLVFGLVLYAYVELNNFYILLLSLMFPVMFTAHIFFQPYKTSLAVGNKLLRAISSWATIYLFIVLVFFLSKTGSEFSRIGVTTSFIFAAFFDFVLIILRDYVGKHNLDSVLIISNDKEKYQRLNKSFYGLKVLDILEPDEELNIENIVSSYAPDKLIIDAKKNYLNRVSHDLLDLRCEVIVVPSFLDDIYINNRTTKIFGMFAFQTTKPSYRNVEELLLKRFFDILIALVLLILFSPLLVFVSFLIKITSYGPILFIQQRHGKNGRIFNLYKFRSMKVEKDDKFSQARRHDPRVTPVGSFIRRTSIDELPQLFNILKGHMSLVGPRPHAIEHNQMYANKIRNFMSRHNVVPGMTGLAQIRGQRGEANEENMKNRFNSDMEYIQNWSLFLDIKILFLTIPSLFNKNIY
tara:strand:- start:3661 stop:4920 length:1260 start_codon:yes stop_codon:yes gene_type:complete